MAFVKLSEKMLKHMYMCFISNLFLIFGKTDVQQGTENQWLIVSFFSCAHAHVGSCSQMFCVYIFKGFGAVHVVYMFTCALEQIKLRMFHMFCIWMFNCRSIYKNIGIYKMYMITVSPEYLGNVGILFVPT